MPPKTRSAVAAAAAKNNDNSVNVKPDPDEPVIIIIKSDPEDDDQGSDDDDPNNYGEEEEEESNSEDEWQPQEIHQVKKRKPRVVVDGDTDQESLDDDDGDDDEFLQEIQRQNEIIRINEKRKHQENGSALKERERKRIKTIKVVPLLQADQGNRNQRDGSTAEGEEEEEDDEEGEEESQLEREQDQVEAEKAWAKVRSRKEAQTNETTTIIKPAKSLTSWLGKGPSASSSDSELATLPWPITCESAQIVDRNSLFIGYVYPIQDPSVALVSAHLSHLTRLVHPTVSVDLLPPHFINVPANKRGSSHDMYAYRILSLKRSRSGLMGPQDYTLNEENQDDGEKWGGERILRVLRQKGASDVLVIVSRWYGGEFLGPIRFEHIENVAKRALERYLELEQIDEIRQKLVYLDYRIRKLRQLVAIRQDDTTVQRQSSSLELLDQDEVPEWTTIHMKKPEEKPYPDLDAVKGQRLFVARNKTIQVLQQRLTSSSPLEQPTLTNPNDTMPIVTEMNDSNDDTQSQGPHPYVAPSSSLQEVQHIQDDHDEDLTRWDELG